MSMIERLHRESVEIDSFLGTTDTCRADVQRHVRAMQCGAQAPLVFIVRLGDELSLHYGDDQVAAAEELGCDEIDAIVFDALDVREGDDVGAIAFELGNTAQDIMRGLQLRYGDPAETEEPRGEACSVTLFPGMAATDRARVAAQVRDAGIGLRPV
ncbi:MAG TPA: hypothetical protein VIJ94_01080 [Caulobacteraceae bacterium]